MKSSIFLLFFLFYIKSSSALLDIDLSKPLLSITPIIDSPPTDPIIPSDPLSDEEDDPTSSTPDDYGAIGSGAKGWKSIAPASNLDSATLLRNYSPNGDGSTLPLYISNDVEPEDVTRVIIVIAAHERNSWAYFDAMKASRDLALADGVAIMAPTFFKRQDKAAGSPSATDLVWYGDDWSSGGDSKWPITANSKPISSFDVIDDLIIRSFNLYPKLQNLVLAGHSMGSQSIHRHSIFSSLASDSRVSYFISNPASYVYLTSSRPLPTITCPSFNDYKYGLSGTLPRYVSSSISSVGGNNALTKRLFTRKVHLTAGQNDYKKGDTRCMANVQGKNHRMRSRLYKQHIEDLNDGKNLPKSWTWNIIPDCGHDEFCMFNSQISQNYLFGENAKGIPSLGDLVKGLGNVIDDSGSGSGNAKSGGGKGSVLQNAGSSSGSGSDSGSGSEDQDEEEGNRKHKGQSLKTNNKGTHQAQTRPHKSGKSSSSDDEDPSSVLLRSNQMKSHQQKQKPFTLRDLIFKRNKDEIGKRRRNRERGRLLSSTRR